MLKIISFYSSISQRDTFLIYFIQIVVLVSSRVEMLRAMADSEVGRALRTVLEKVVAASKSRPQVIRIE